MCPVEALSLYMIVLKHNCNLQRAYAACFGCVDPNLESTNVLKTLSILI